MNDIRFAFGENWSRFLQHLNEERISDAEASLRAVAGRLEGKRFLDAGCGSGLFSLAARRLGAKVHSFDYDTQSVACTQSLRERYFPGDPQWKVEQGSVLDAAYLRSLGRFDVVYSWGVLHHTGAMWTAIDQVLELLEPGGRAVIAIYNDQGWLSGYWRTVKKAYHRGALSRTLVVALHAPYLIGARWLVQTLKGTRRQHRGMTLYYDMLDWLGGYPFEVASPSAIERFGAERGLAVEVTKTCGRRHGCNEFVLSRPVSIPSHAS